MEEHPLVCYGDHQSLANALSNRDIDSFRRALHSPTEVEKRDIESSMTIFEKACQTPNCAQFIEECILAGCDVNKLNSELNKRPINFVVDSHCVDNLAALLRDPSVDVNSKGPSLKTPVNSLAEQITNENFRNVFPCIKLLIQHGADVNVPDWRETTPIVHILKNRNLSAANKEVIVKYLLQNVVEVDIDSHRNGEARKLLQKSLPEIELMPKSIDTTLPNSTSSHRQWNFNHLFLALKNEQEDEFLQGIQQVAEQNPMTMQELFTAAESRQTLLIVAVEKDLVLAIKKMLQLGADVNFFVDTTRDTMSPAKCACIRGHWRSLEILLRAPELDLNSAPLLPITVKNLGEKPTKVCDYERCFEMLLSHRNIDVNQMDMNHSTALHYAVKFNNSRAILELLKHGAYV
ncbi:transient receptor potential cation channel protein painless-like, partial [Contarinia nasturtii]|uniref:transient receptor potential cation channel protein painless-like n=1 Tax=Contarinia nasturtii TaxID=265458 RepID=UPI0012D43712